jgi:hypothetical protein
MLVDLFSDTERLVKSDEGAGEGEMAMSGFRAAVKLLCAVALLACLRSGPVVLGEEKKPARTEGKIAGILIEKRKEFLSVKADGDDEPVKYLIGDPPDKKLDEALKGIFDASRVQLTYKKEGDSRKLVTIKEQVFKASGTITGKVVKVHNDFWVEVKPKSGPADAFAPGASNWNDKQFMAMLKGLQPGDSVTIKYSTDFERHRIESLRKN